MSGLAATSTRTFVFAMLILFVTSIQTAQAQDCALWTLRASTGPSPRAQHAMAFDSARGRTVMYGGMPSGGIDVAEPEYGRNFDTWEWNGSRWILRATAYNVPGGRVGHAMAFDNLTNYTWSFGGFRLNTFEPHAFRWNSVAWVLIGLSPYPTARVGHAVVYDGQHSRVVMFGGLDPDIGFMGDTWDFNNGVWQIRASTPALIRSDHAMAYDSLRHHTVLFGGDGPNGYLGDTWEWDGNTWTQVSSTGPSMRAGHTMAFDSARGRTVLFGGLNSNGILHDTWEWDGYTWTQRTASPPPPARYSHAMVFDSIRSRIVIFGGIGENNIYLGDTWELPSGPLTLSPVNNQTVLPGQSASFSVIAAGPPPITYQWRKNGIAISDGFNISGATSSTLTINPVDVSDRGDYDVVATNSCGPTTSNVATLHVILPCPGDVTGDGYVNVNDLLLVINGWGVCP